MLIGHKKQWELLKKRFENDQLAHAYLFTGPKEIGKKTFTIEFAELIGCKFPDLLVVEPAEGEISILKIREVQNFLAYKSYHGNYKMVVVNDAHLMNQEAQSCFLKTLEEPKGKTLIILVSSKPDLVLRTIVSRCQTIKFHRPKDLAPNPEKVKKEEEILKDFLNVADLSLAEKFKYAKSIDFENQNLSCILEAVEKHYRKALLAQISSGKTADKKVKNIINLIEDINNKMIFTNANPKLALEILLMEL